MIKNLHSFFLIFISVLWVSCSEDTEQYSIRFHLVYGDQPLVMLQDYEYPDGKTIRFTRVSFFISEMALHSGPESMIIKEIDHINFTASHQDMAGAVKGLTFFNEEIELTSVDGLSFHIGLTDQQNNTVPSDYEPGHPLANSGEYWIGWSSYIFAKIEGWVDLDEDGEAETSMALHLGSNDVRKDLFFDIPGNTDTLNIEFDVRNIFQGNSGIYDIESDPQIHSLSQLDSAMELADNLSHSFKIN